MYNSILRNKLFNTSIDGKIKTIPHFNFDLNFNIKKINFNELKKFFSDTKNNFDELIIFIKDRLINFLRDQNFTAEEVDAVTCNLPNTFNTILNKLHALRSFVDLDDSAFLASSNKRVTNILKKYEFDILFTDKHLQFINDLDKLPEILICCVGLMADQKNSEKNKSTRIDVIRSNFEGPLNIISEFANYFEERGSGTIVGISSVAGDRGCLLYTSDAAY